MYKRNGRIRLLIYSFKKNRINPTKLNDLSNLYFKEMCHEIHVLLYFIVILLIWPMGISNCSKHSSRIVV